LYSVVFWAGILPANMKILQLHFEMFLPRPKEEVFPFFAAAENLEAITPDWLRFSLLTPPPREIGKGTRLEYRLHLRGIPVRWTSEITAWEPPFLFVDEQRRGPYRFWRHEHRFADAPAGTVVADDLRYALWGGRLIDWLFVRRDLQRIFEFRQQQLSAKFH
jgi:ligand-binding SRPBCC domain-containing protein